MLRVLNNSLAFSISIVLLNAANKVLSFSVLNIISALSTPAFIFKLFVNPIRVFISSDCISTFSASVLFRSSTLLCCLSDRATGKLSNLLFINSYIPIPALH